MAKAKTEADGRNLPTGQQLAESGYSGFNEDVGPPVAGRKRTTLGGTPAPDDAPEKPTETKPPKKPAK